MQQAPIRPNHFGKNAESFNLHLIRPMLSPLGALHRYFIAANKMRILFEKTFSNTDVLNRFPEADALTRAFMLHMDDYGIFMFYWYSGLYVVIEGYRELQLQDAKIDALLQSPNVDALRLLRNASFHFQKEFFSPKMMHFIGSPDSVPWVHSLTEAFSDYFLREMRKV